MHNRAPTSLIGWKERGRRLFAEKDYHGALSAFQHCLEGSLSGEEEAMIRSHLVACRLPLGQTSAAISDAKRCVQLRPNWARGHVRLAMSYSQNGQSNVACQSLQTALRYDPNHPTARSMLIRELQRDRHLTQNQQDSSEPELDPEEDPQSNGTPFVQSSLKDWSQRIRQTWRHMSEDQRMLVQILVVLVVLYLSFGGRFGWEHRATRGNYSAENAYSEYRQGRSTPQQSSNQYSFLMDGHAYRLLGLLGITYLLHKWGFSVFQILFALNLGQGGGIRRRRRRGW